MRRPKAAAIAGGAPERARSLAEALEQARDGRFSEPPKLFQKLGAEPRYPSP